MCFVYDEQVIIAVSMLQCVTSMMRRQPWYVAVCCSVLQCGAKCCSVLQRLTYMTSRWQTHSWYPDTTRSVEDQTPNARRNPNRNPEWWGDFSQLVEIEKLRFLRISRYKFKLRFWLNLNSSVSPGTNSNRDFRFAVDSNLTTIQDFD